MRISLLPLTATLQVASGLFVGVGRPFLRIHGALGARDVLAHVLGLGSGDAAADGALDVAIFDDETFVLELGFRDDLMSPQVGRVPHHVDAHRN